ncbi:MAG TPA: hypothetical protein PK604_14090 [Acetivibrio clariflavus]|nr:hypothetical protein [Acetivibrio clariflavus]
MNVQEKDGFIYLNESTKNIMVDFKIPKDVYVESFHINWSKALNDSASNTEVNNSEISNDNFELYIYNRKFDRWEILSNDKYINTEGQYCGLGGYVHLKAVLTNDENEVKISCPQISIDGQKAAK